MCSTAVHGYCTRLRSCVSHSAESDRCGEWDSTPKLPARSRLLRGFVSKAEKLGLGPVSIYCSENSPIINQGGDALFIKVRQASLWVMLRGIKGNPRHHRQLRHPQIPNVRACVSCHPRWGFHLAPTSPSDSMRWKGSSPSTRRRLQRGISDPSTN
jgi:hypothetical protein